MKRTNYKLVPYSEENYEFVYNVKKIAYKKYVEHYFKEWNEELQREMYDKFINDRAKHIKLIVVGNEKVGFIEGLDINETEYEQGNICILPKFQGQGIGTDFLNNVINEHKHQDIYLKVFKINPAQELYKRLGFTIINETYSHFNMVRKK